MWRSSEPSFPKFESYGRNRGHVRSRTPKGINYLPNYPIPAGEALSPDDYFEKVVRDGMQTRKARVWERELADGTLTCPMEDYEKPLARNAGH